jgi:hypothetical protein
MIFPHANLGIAARRGCFRVRRHPTTIRNSQTIHSIHESLFRPAFSQHSLVQRKFLHPQIADLANVQRIFVAAIDGIDRSELL